MAGLLFRKSPKPSKAGSGKFENSTNMASKFGIMPIPKLKRANTIKPQTIIQVLSSSSLYYLLIFVPIGIISGALHFNPTAVFTFNILAILPLAMLLSFATDELSVNAGQTVGALLNASFGNAVEMIVSTVALFKGEIRIVQSSMLGAILSNVLLGLGVCLTIGGLHHDCYFNATAASTMSSLMAVSSISLMIPTALTFAFNSANHSASDSLSSILILSRGTAIILLILYALYLYFQLVTHSKFFEEGSAPGSPTKGQNGTPIPEKPSFKEKEVDEPKFQILTPTQALATLFALSSLIAICAEYLVSAIDDVVLALHIPKPFIGLIILPLVGNFAEYLSAALAARKQKMDLALTIALGSSMQISLLITPTLVLLGWVISQPMSLSFEPFGAVVFFLSVIVVAGLVDDGESNYLEGSMLVGTYIIIAIAFFVFPDKST